MHFDSIQERSDWGEGRDLNKAGETQEQTSVRVPGLRGSRRGQGRSFPARTKRQKRRPATESRCF